METESFLSRYLINLNGINPLRMETQRSIKLNRCNDRRLKLQFTCKSLGTKQTLRNISMLFYYQHCTMHTYIYVYCVF